MNSLKTKKNIQQFGAFNSKRAILHTFSVIDYWIHPNKNLDVMIILNNHNISIFFTKEMRGSLKFRLPLISFRKVKSISTFLLNGN